MTPTPETFDFRYAHVTDVDPGFKEIPSGTYNLRFTKSKDGKYLYPYGTEGKERLSLSLTIYGDPNFSGRRIFESLFPNKFSMIVLRQIAEATGVEQTSPDAEEFVKELCNVGATIKVEVASVPDVYRDGAPNPKTVKADGTPGNKAEIQWKAGVWPGD